MKIIFLGAGEAFDENTPNTSVLVSSGKTKLLLDCGYSTPTQLWKYNPDKDFLDAIYITHCHADHYFGLPAVFLRMWEDRRKKPLKLICQKSFRKTIEDMLELAYPGFSNRFEFVIDFTEVSSGETLRLDNLTLSFASTTHSLANLAIKVSDGEHSVCYSGDGMFNEETERLYKSSDLVIQETYLLDETKIGHANVMQSIEMAKRNNVRCVALIHLNRNFRSQEIKRINNIIKENSSERLKILLPRPFDEYDFPQN